MPPGYANISAEFRDLDAYVASLTGADFRYTMTHPGVPLWKIDRVFLPGGLVVQSAWGGCGAILESGTPDFNINLFLHREGYFQVLGQELDLAMEGIRLFLEDLGEWSFHCEHGLPRVPGALDHIKCQKYSVYWF